MTDSAEIFMKEALNWLQRTGWPTQQRDGELADAIYADWLRDSRSTWIAHRWRDRSLLSEQLAAGLAQQHAKADAGPIHFFLMMELEFRARHDGENIQISSDRGK